MIIVICVFIDQCTLMMYACFSLVIDLCFKVIYKINVFYHKSFVVNNVFFLLRLDGYFVIKYN